MFRYDDPTGAACRGWWRVTAWKGWKPLRVACAFAAWAYAGLAALWFGLWLATGEALLPVRLALYFAAWIALGLIAISAFAVGQRHWRLAAVAVPLALLLALPYAPQFMPRFGVRDGGGPSLTVMSYNVLGRNRDYDAMAEVLRVSPADIVLLQEIGNAAELLNRLQSLYYGSPVHAVAERNRALLIISRYPLTSLEPLKSIQRAVVHTDCGDIYLWNLHGPKPFEDVSSRDRTVEMLVADMQARQVPSIAAGDFNMTERSAAYQYFRQHFGNAHEKAGFGLGATFPAPGRNLGRFLPAMIRIDHVFYSNDLTAVHTEVLSEAGGSDHYPVRSDFSRDMDSCSRGTAK